MSTEWKPIDQAEIKPFVHADWFKPASPTYLLATDGRSWWTSGNYGYTERGKGRWLDARGYVISPTHFAEVTLPATSAQDPTPCEPISANSEALRKRYKPEEPLLNDDGSLHQSTLRINGERFRCSCGCNVFHRPDKTKLDLYQCNGCPNRYETVAA